MNNNRTLDRKYETIAWGLLFIWWGLRWSLLIFLPEGSGLLGSGLILLGLKAIRSLEGIPTNRSTTLLGIFALVSGGLLVAPAILRLPFELPVFETMLIVLGVVLLANELIQLQKAELRSS
jgi:hypothetical protein